MPARSAVKKHAKMLTLEHYLPYRISILSNQVSGIIAKAYRDKFGLSTNEWRIMAVLAEYPGASADEVSSTTQTEKSIISRALKRLLNRNLVLRKVDQQDRRRQNLQLSRTGKEVYLQIVPLAYDYETELLNCLSCSEQQQLNKLIEKLHGHAQTIQI